MTQRFHAVRTLFRNAANSIFKVILFMSTVGHLQTITTITQARTQLFLVPPFIDPSFEVRIQRTVAFLHHRLTQYGQFLRSHEAISLQWL